MKTVVCAKLLQDFLAEEPRPPRNLQQAYPSNGQEVIFDPPQVLQGYLAHKKHPLP